MCSDSSVSLDSMPADVLYVIFGKLDYKDINNLSEVNKRLYHFASDNLLWRNKLESDLRAWKIISSNHFPVEIYEHSAVGLKTIDYKDVYSKCCPDVLTKMEILKKLKSYKHAKPGKIEETVPTINGLLNSPIHLLHQIKDYFLNIQLFNEISSRFLAEEEMLAKIIMFGPGLETTNCCLVTNLLWKVYNFEIFILKPFSGIK
jgi:hypothetical protein